MLLTLAAACVLALLVAVAPALSLRPYQAAPVDFERAAPADAVLGERSADGVISTPLRAPKRFNLVGLRWKERGAEPALAVRTRRAGGEWSRWTAVPTHPDHSPDPGTGEAVTGGASEPVWAGEADYLQYRISKRPRGLRLHFVNTEGTATAKDRVLNAIRRTANAGAVTLGRVATAEAGAPRPQMVPRADWGASSCKPRRRAARGNVKVAFIHHTVTTNSYSRSQGRSIVLGICRFHRNSNGWDDIGYNFLVDKYGVIYEGRAGGADQPVVGAQAQGYNAQSTGIANLGTHTSRKQTEAALRSMARLIRWKLPLHGAPTSGSATLISAGGSTNRYPRGTRVRLQRVSGHRSANSTACPGSALQASLGRSAGWSAT